MAGILEEKYGTGFRRWASAFVDGLVFIPLDYIDTKVQSSITNNSGLFLWLIFMTCVTISYSVLLHFRYGQTLGKMFMKVRVLDISEQRGLNFRQAVMRDIFFIALSLLNIGALGVSLFFSEPNLEENALSHFQGYVSAISVAWVLLELISMLTNNKRRAVHDFIAGTVVVKLPEVETIESRADSA
jgi:uncharacterized RDD family membrane protein YckC